MTECVGDMIRLQLDSFVSPVFFLVFVHSLLQLRSVVPNETLKHNNNVHCQLCNMNTALTFMEYWIIVKMSSYGTERYGVYVCICVSVCVCVYVCECVCLCVACGK